MDKKNGQMAISATRPKPNDNANLQNEKQICKVFDYFKYTDGSTLSASDKTGVPRCSPMFPSRSTQSVA